MDVFWKDRGKLKKLIQYLEVECPADGTQQLLEIQRDRDGTRIASCTNTGHRSNCGVACSCQADSVAYNLEPGVPTFELEELGFLSVGEALARFKNLPVRSLPVLDRGRLVGSVSLLRLAQKLETFDESSLDSVPVLVDSFDSTIEPIADTTTTEEAARVFRATQQTELFVVDSEHRFVGLLTPHQALSPLSVALSSVSKG